MVSALVNGVEGGKFGIPIIYDRVCQQALLNRLEPIFEPVFDDASFGYRRGRSTQDALRKIWKEIKADKEWIVDADLKDFFGSVDHEKLLMLVAQCVADGRVLRLIEAMLKAGSYGKGRLFPTERGTPQDGVVSPLLSNILLTPFDWEMRRRGYQVYLRVCGGGTRCRSGGKSDPGRVGRATASAENADRACSARVRVSWVQNQARPAATAATEQDPQWCPIGCAVCVPAREIDPAVHGRDAPTYQAARAPFDPRADRVVKPRPARWGHYYKRAHVRLLFNRLDRWIVRRIWSHRFKHWRCGGWKALPLARLYGEFGLVNLVGLIPSIASQRGVFVKAACGRTARAV
ncbi:MAG: reverse transcriptase domain-containing protein [Gammaproteobacteria bacterium]